MDLHLIINPNAGNRSGLAAGEKAAAVLDRAGAHVKLHVSTYPGQAVEHAEQLGRELSGGPSPTAGDSPESRRPGVIAVGGDGTLFEIVNGLLRGSGEARHVHGPGTAGPGHSAPGNSRDRSGAGHHTPGDGHGGSGGRDRSGAAPLPFVVGQIPIGTGNSFLKDIQIESPEQAVQVILGGATRPVDVGTLECSDGSFYFVNLLGAGFVSSVAHRARDYKRFGALSYVIGVLQETIGLAPQPVTLTLDDRVEIRDGIFVEICNSRYTGGAMMMAPDALIDDGLLDVVVMSRVTRRKLLRLFPRIFSGTHVQDDSIEVFRARSVKVATERPWLLTPDGETFGSTPITVGIIPGLLEMYCP